MTAIAGAWREKLLLLIALAMLGLAPAHTAFAQGKLWSEPRKLGASGDSAIAAAGRHVYVAYGSAPVFVVRSDDSGETFSAPTLLARGGDMHETDSLAADSNVVVGITFAPAATGRDWCCQRQLGNLMLYRSTDFGASWLPAFPLTSSGGAFRVSVAMALPYVHVVWSDFRGGRWAIYYRRSTDGGATWEPEVRLVPSGLEETNRPQIAVLGKTVHVVWMDNRDGHAQCYIIPHCTEVYYLRSMNAGATWDQPRRMTFNNQPLLAGRPDVAAFAGGAVAIAYDQDLKIGKAGVQHVLRSFDGGNTWLAPLQLGKSPEETHPAAAALGQDGVSAWFKQDGGLNLGLRARLTQDSGRTWLKEEKVSSSNASTPHVAIADGFLHIVWLEGDSIMYRRRALAAGK
jgi:hypothetical protein